jgi:hypothetical protein
MNRFFSLQHRNPESPTASRPSPAGSLRSAWTPRATPEWGAATRKTSALNTFRSGWNQGSRIPAYEKENPRRGYEVCTSKTLESRPRQLPTNPLSCGKTRVYQSDLSSLQPLLGPWFFPLGRAEHKEVQPMVQ